ncbi:MAG: FKBP-type peptidyl-prolyl cis-trans isomerase [Luteolibacter sp.]
MRSSTQPRRSILPQLAGMIAALSLTAQADPNMPAVPDDVKAPPADALKSESGLASKVLQEGSGSEKPSVTDQVKVHYSGWTTDGKMFDSSVTRGEPASFPLNGVIKGWTEGLQLMVEGEKRRFWIPAELAYGENPGGGRPGGMLVFDVELLEIQQQAKVPADAKKTADGVAYEILKDGDGASPTAADIVTFHLHASTLSGQVLQDTRQAGESAPSALGSQLSPQLMAVVAEMKLGEKRRCWLPEANLPGGHVVLDFELISFKPAPPPPAVPEDVGAVPDDAEKSPSGLASKLLQKGSGDKKPSADQSVRVHYSGWTTDGKMFDSSVTRGEPTSFPLNGVIKGWTEGLQLMTVGEKRRFWIPAELAYGENPGGGRPGGMLVFDVELLEILGQ